MLVGWWVDGLVAVSLHELFVLGTMNNLFYKNKKLCLINYSLAEYHHYCGCLSNMCVQIVLLFGCCIAK